MDYNSPEMKKLRTKALIASSLAMLTGGLTTMVFSVCMTSLSAELAFTTEQSGQLSSFLLIGQLIGGLGAGWMADKLGSRAKVLAVATLGATLFNFLVSFAGSYAMFAIERFFSGVFLGPCYYLGCIFLSEYYETNKRGSVAGIAAGVWALGYIVNCLLSGYVIESFGWRWMFRVATIPFIGGLWMLTVADAPTTKSMVAARESDEAVKAKKNEYAQLFADPELRKSLILWAIHMILYFYGYYAIITWLPAYLQGQLNVNLKSVGWFSAVSYLGMLIGKVLGGKACDIWGRKKMMIIGLFATALCIPLFALTATVDNIIWYMSAFGICYGIPPAIHGTIMGESFPTNLRGTAVGFSFNIGRIGSITAPIVIGYLAAAGKAPLAMATGGIGYGLAAILTIFQKEKGYDASAIIEKLD